jgi:hypothetical protein
MISVTGITGNYILQPELIEKHTTTINWLSASVLWKSELRTFQKILDERAPRFTSIDNKKKIDHFQNLITYYSGEVVDSLRKKLRDHETHLATMLESKDEANVQYYKEHANIVDEVTTFSESFKEFRKEFFEFIQTVA